MWTSLHAHPLGPASHRDQPLLIVSRRRDEGLTLLRCIERNQREVANPPSLCRVVCTFLWHVQKDKEHETTPTMGCFRARSVNRCRSPVLGFRVRSEQNCIIML